MGPRPARGLCRQPRSGRLTLVQLRIAVWTGDTRDGDKPTAGLMTDTINMTRYSTVEIDFVADDPGPSLLHCHHQDHQDEGFMGMVTYL